MITPAAWSGPFRFLYSAVTNFSDFQNWNGEIMYMGEVISGREPPWHYLLVWMAITVPMPALVFFVVGSIKALYYLLRRRFSFTNGTHLLLSASLVFMGVPILAAILLDSTLYNDWRQFYFLLTPILIIAVYGIKILYEKCVREGNIVWKVLMVVIGLWVGGYYLSVGSWMIREHPHQNVYFNNTVSEIFGGKQGFERDYWRLSLRQGVEILSGQDDRDPIYVYEDSGALWRALQIIPDTVSDRFQVTERVTPRTDYIITTYRIPNDYLYNEYASIVVDGLPILTIFKVK